MNTLQQMNDIEELKELKARYARYLDTKEWSKWADLFTDDYEAIILGAPRGTKNDPTEMTQSNIQNIVGALAKALESVITIHRIFLPEITLVSPTQATGVWGLNDIIYMPTNRFEGWGHYHEEYAKVGGAWKIRRLKVTRLKVEERWYQDDEKSVNA